MLMMLAVGCWLLVVGWSSVGCGKHLKRSQEAQRAAREAQDGRCSAGEDCVHMHEQPVASDRHHHVNRRRLGGSSPNGLPVVGIVVPDAEALGQRGLERTPVVPYCGGGGVVRRRGSEVVRWWGGEVMGW